MDFIILVIVDCFAKGVHFRTLPAHYNAFKVATLFLDIVCKHHGFPYSIVSNSDPIFISCFLKEIFHLSGTKLWMSISYHLQTDGQSKVINRVLEQYLCSFVHAKPLNGVSLLLWPNGVIIP